MDLGGSDGEEENEETSSDFQSDSDNDIEDSDEIPQFTQMTYDPLPIEKTVSDREKTLEYISAITSYGDEPNLDAILRFVVGPKEPGKRPGTGVKELDRYKTRAWRELYKLGKSVNWRRALANDFDKDLINGPYSFTINGIEWMTVVHYLLGQLYMKHDPQYALKFSMKSMNDNDSYWARVKGALNAHTDNIKSGSKHRPDEDFGDRLNEHLQVAMLAKFTQNEAPKKALLLTEDAIISIRGGPKKILDVVQYNFVRDFIKKNPHAIFKGITNGQPIIEYNTEEIPHIIEIEQLNFGYIFPELRDPKLTIAGGMKVENLYKSIILPTSIETETASKGECTVYVFIGGVSVNKDVLSNVYGDPVYVRRPVYALEKFADNGKSIFIAYQRTPTSYSRNYLRFSLEKENIEGWLYLEPFAEGYGVFLVTSSKDNNTLDFITAFTKGVVEPRGITLSLPKISPIYIGSKEKIVRGIYRQFTAMPSMVRLHRRVKTLLDFAQNEMFQTMSRENTYEALNILERLATSLADINGEDTFSDNPSAISIYNKTKSEIKEKKLPIQGDDMIKELVDSVKYGDDYALVEESLNYPEPVFSDRGLEYREIHIRTARPSEVGAFKDILAKTLPLREGEDRDVEINRALAKMYIANLMLMPSSQQWAIHKNFILDLRSKFSISLEGFTSPLNSYLLPFGVPFCSVFDEIDRPFGGLGNIFRLDFSTFIKDKSSVFIVMNPPFIEYILNDTCDLIEKWFRIAADKPDGLGVKLTILFISPLWKDAYHVDWLRRYQLVKLNNVLDKGSYYYDDLTTGESIRASFSSILAIISNDSSFDMTLFGTTLRHLTYA